MVQVAVVRCRVFSIYGYWCGLQTLLQPYYAALANALGWSWLNLPLSAWGKARQQYPQLQTEPPSCPDRHF